MRSKPASSQPTDSPNQRLTLVLLPGMDGSGTLFAPFIAALNGQMDVQVMRYPSQDGLGYAQLQAIARQALPREGRFVLLGESFSGPVAIALAASRPPGLVGLILCATFASNPHPVFTPLAGLAAWLPFKAAPLALVSHMLLGRFATPALLAALKAALAPLSASAMQARMQAVLQVDVRAQLRSLDIPVQYLRATQDSVVPACASHRIARDCPQVDMVAIRAPHFLLQAAPMEAAAAVQGFMRGLQNAASQSSRKPS